MDNTIVKKISGLRKEIVYGRKDPLDAIETITMIYTSIFNNIASTKSNVKTISGLIVDLNGTTTGISTTSLLFEDILNCLILKRPFIVSNYALVSNEPSNKPINVKYPSDIKMAPPTLANELCVLFNVLGIEAVIDILIILLQTIPTFNIEIKNTEVLSELGPYTSDN